MKTKIRITSASKSTELKRLSQPLVQQPGTMSAGSAEAPDFADEAPPAEAQLVVHFRDARLLVALQAFLYVFAAANFAFMMFYTLKAGDILNPTCDIRSEFNVLSDVLVFECDNRPSRAQLDNTFKADQYNVPGNLDAILAQMAAHCGYFNDYFSACCVLGAVLMAFYGVYMQLKSLEFEDAKLTMIKQGEVTYKNLLLGVYLRLPFITAINSCTYAGVNVLLLWLMRAGERSVQNESASTYCNWSSSVVFFLWAFNIIFWVLFGIFVVLAIMACFTAGKQTKSATELLESIECNRKDFETSENLVLPPSKEAFLNAISSKYRFQYGQGAMYFFPRE